MNRTVFFSIQRKEENHNIAHQTDKVLMSFRSRDLPFIPRAPQSPCGPGSPMVFCIFRRKANNYVYIKFFIEKNFF